MRITVLFTTYNRCGDLRDTLASMREVDQTGLDVEFVLIDNNSSDGTKEVAEEFLGTFPLTYLFEGRQGKNCALNKALDEIDLGDIVVFTDDDVELPVDWLQKIRQITDRWADRSVFGGRVEPIWPGGQGPPKWIDRPLVRQLGFSIQDFPDSEGPYPEGRKPNGANYWVRNSVFEGGRRFNEAVGPRPKGRIMGSETSFILSLKQAGHEPIFSPESTLGHKIQKENVSVFNALKRAFRYGRTHPHMGNFPHKELLAKKPLKWWLKRLMSLFNGTLRLCSSIFYVSKSSRVNRAMETMIGIGSNIESMKLAKKGAIPEESKST